MDSSEGIRRELCGALSRAPHKHHPFRLSDIWKAPVHDFPMRDEILRQYFPLSPEMEVLEIGPGAGYTSFWVVKHVRHLTAVDVSAANIARLQESFQGTPNIQLVCADVCAPNLPGHIGKRVDAIFGLEIFEYLPDPGSCLKNLGAMLRPGGTLLLEFPNYPAWRSPGITCFRTQSELGEMLQAAGFVHWEIDALRLSPYARLIFQNLHERPLQIYRRFRDGLRPKPMSYDQTWTFQNWRRLQTPKYVLHTAWFLIKALMRWGGDCFERARLGEEILHHDILLIARR